ncbi:MAG: STAS domain-containing protein [Chromatiales bacterium]|nr:STAS domain-containing protein [Chromatiales bacterium]
MPWSGSIFRASKWSTNPAPSECAQILAAARKAKRKLQVSGVDRLIALLQDLNRATHSRAVHWLLLLELYQTLGQQDNFEDLAVDYAVRFEVSPPSWSEVQAAEVVQAAPAASLRKTTPCSSPGEITPANDSALQQFGSYAATHTDVLVDLAQVTRVDYGSVSQFISVLMQCLGSGKSITLRGHNALIHELFRVMGIDQLAHLVPSPPATDAPSVFSRRIRLFHVDHPSHGTISRHHHSVGPTWR